jgi:carbon monoxide dehydrogenase subunit G
MQMSDTRQISATPAQVYAALLDPEMLKACVPGATEVAGSPETGFLATVVQKVGPVKATFKGEVTITDMVQDVSLRIDGAGKGGAAGFAKGGADVRVSPNEGGCELSYDVEAKIGGKLAQLVNNLQEALEGPKEEGGDDATGKKGWFGRSKS